VYNFASQVGNRINAFLSSLPGIIGNLFVNAWNAAKNFTSSGISAVISFVSQLPGRIGSAISAIPGILSSLFSSAMNAARNAVSSGISAVVGAFQAIPGAIRSLAGSLYSAGADMIHGAINGVLSAVGGLVSAARDAAARAVQGFKDALHIGSPSRLMAVEVGKPIIQGVIVGMESMQDKLADATMVMSLASVAEAKAGIPTVPYMPAAGAAGAPTSGATFTINQTVNALPSMSATDVANESNRKLAFGVRTGVNSIVSAGG
jgi:phage-related protein